MQARKVLCFCLKSRKTVLQLANCAKIEEYLAHRQVRQILTVGLCFLHMPTCVKTLNKITGVFLDEYVSAAPKLNYNTYEIRFKQLNLVKADFTLGLIGGHPLTNEGVIMKVEEEQYNEEQQYIYRPWTTLKDGTRVYARNYGKKAFKIPIKRMPDIKEE